jgi:hypothetical protein
MERCGQGAGAKTAAAAVARENTGTEAILQPQLILHADALRKRDELRAAGEEYVLAIIDFDAVDLE